MSGFLYFAEGVSAVTAANVAAWDLAYAFDGPVSYVETRAGPGEKPGCLFGRAGDDGEPPPKLRYDPKATPSQPLALRVPLHGRPPLWVLWSPEDPPVAEDLERAEIVAGYALSLGDDGPGGASEWIVPLARIFETGASRFPAALAIGPEGAVVREPLPRYAALCGEAERIWQAVRDQFEQAAAEGREPVTIDDADGYAVACRALAVNYRVGPVEVGVLRLLTTANLMRVLGAFVDLPSYSRDLVARVEAARAKKNDGTDPPAGGDGCDGGGA